MKLNNYPYRTAALLLLVMLAAACTGDDDFAAPPDEGTATAAPLTITVTDGAYAPAETPDGGNTPDTRAVERGYGTEFTVGDQIGLYVVKKEDASNPADARRAFVHQNLCLTHDGTGWTLPNGTKLTHRTPVDGEILYFAYYPYQSNMAGKVDINAQGNESPTTEAHNFFSGLISGWTPATDQSTYAAYTANDLMVARGEVAKRTDGTDGSVLSFTMKHQMTLVVYRLPTLRCTYTEMINGAETEKSYRLYSKVETTWRENDNTCRLLMKSADVKTTMTYGYYKGSPKKLDIYGVEIPPNTFGEYFLFTLDGGRENVTKRPLQVGDFYMNDGTIMPKENVTDDIDWWDMKEVMPDCLGVVFWVGENDEYHWTKTANQKGDRLLMRHHPGCEHGMVVAKHDASSSGSVWATGSAASTRLYDWAENFGSFNAEESADWSAIQESAVTQYGYCMSHLVKLYSTHDPDATFPAYNMISDYATRYPAPGSSSGWYMPGKGELTMMCYGKAENFAGNKDTDRRDLLNGLFLKAEGKEFAGSYWSITDSPGSAWYLNFDGVTSYGDKPKSETAKVRAVLAF